MLILRIIFFSIFSCLLACQTTKELDVWPLVYYDQDSEKQTTQLDLLASVYSQTNTPTKDQYAFRPFFVGEMAKDKKDNQILFLWPFLRYHETPDDTLIAIIPFFYSRDLQKPITGERDYDWFFLPFGAFGGTDTTEGSYFYMGFWGNIKGLLGYDEITGKPFPFYVTARDGEYFSRSYMWPFFRFGEGGGKKFEFYAFMYSYFEKENQYIRRSFLWPLIHYNLEELDKKPRTDFMFFPIYGQSTSEDSLAWMFLWPFISYSSHNNGYREYNAPWPFFKYRYSKEIEEFRIWPLYWTNKQTADDIKSDDLILLWPFFWSFHTDTPTHTKNSLYLAPFYAQHWRKGKDENAKETTELKIWPLFDYKNQEDGSFRSRILSPLWFDDYAPDGFEKTWLPLFTFFDYNKGKNGDKTVSFLGPLFHFKEEQDSSYKRFLFFSYKNKKTDSGDKGRFSVLGGLFEYNWQEKNNGIRFLYLPIWSNE